MRGILTQRPLPQIAGARVRKATHEDFEAVMDIDRNVFNGLDYLAGLYHSYIDHPMRKCYVCEIYGKIVGFEMIFVVDGGHALVCQAGRVVPNMRSQGVSVILGEGAIKDVSKEFPVERVYWTTKNAEATFKISAFNTRLKYCERNRFSVAFTPSGFAKLMKSAIYEDNCNKLSINSLRVLTPSATADALHSIRNIGDLCPIGLWCVKLEPFAHMASNFPIITEEFKSTVLTSSETGAKVKDISFASGFTCGFGFRFIVDFYVDRNLDEELKAKMLAAHVLKQYMLIAQRKISGNVSIRVDIHDKNISNEYIKSILLQKLMLGDIEPRLNYFEDTGFIVKIETGRLDANL